MLVAPYNMEELHLMIPMIQKILTKYKVILRQRYEWLELPEYMELLRCLRGDLCIDMSESFLVSSYKESFCLICGMTTTKFTYPLLANKPVVTFPPLKERIKDVKLEVNDALGINLSGYENAENSILEILEGIQANAESWGLKISKYREENVYNFGTASQWLADYLVAKYHL